MRNAVNRALRGGTGMTAPDRTDGGDAATQDAPRARVARFATPAATRTSVAPAAG